MRTAAGLDCRNALQASFLPSFLEDQGATGAFWS
jgi:hypothetical protein